MEGSQVISQLSRLIDIRVFREKIGFLKKIFRLFQPLTMRRFQSAGKLSAMMLDLSFLGETRGFPLSGYAYTKSSIFDDSFKV